MVSVAAFRSFPDVTQMVRCVSGVSVAAFRSFPDVTQMIQPMTRVPLANTTCHGLGMRSVLGTRHPDFCMTVD